MTTSRRDALTLAAGLAAAPSLAAAAPDVLPNGAQAIAGKALTRIAFGSCAKESKDQPIWEAVLAAKPDLFIFLGDNVYLDTRDPNEMRAKYAQLAAKPGFQKLRATTPILAVWDDHDYGENDAGSEYPIKEEARKIFCDFWGEAAASPRRSRDGIYSAYLFGPADKRIQIILPDLRFNRSEILPLDLGGKSYAVWEKELAAAGKPVPGPYARNPELKASMLGEEQWRWLEDQLRLPADIRILASSLQVIADFPGWEAWINYAQDHQRLIETIRKTKANGLICLSGDTHYGEISRLNANVPYPLWDFTSSGLTEVWHVLPPNALRVGEAYRARNFGLLDISWNKMGGPKLKVDIRGEQGQVALSQSIDVASLRMGSL
ncbi:PhoD-like phosphatase, metallophosphatase domain [Caulobacteraceae bacterium]